MKQLFFILLITFNSCFLVISSKRISYRYHDTRHITIECLQKPADISERRQQTIDVTHILTQMNVLLRHKRLIAHVQEQIHACDSLFVKIKKHFLNIFHLLFFHKKSLLYPHKMNELFIVKKDDQKGTYSIYIPDGVTEMYCIDLAQQIIDQSHMNFSVHTDYEVKVQACYEKKIKESLEQEFLAGTYLTLSELQKVRQNSAEHMYPYLFWWQNIPTTGIRIEEPFWPLSYPYLPHAFPLWQLAPKMGLGSNVWMIDTGIAAFAIKGEKSYKKNQDLHMNVHGNSFCYNVVHSEFGIEDHFEQLVDLIKKNTDNAVIDTDRIHTELLQWIVDYVTDKNTVAMTRYFLNYGKADLVQTLYGTKGLTSTGQRIINEIVKGSIGFHPKNIKKPYYSVVALDKPHDQNNIILEFLPTASIDHSNDQSFLHNRISYAQRFAAYNAGHGSHVAGIIGGKIHTLPFAEAIFTHDIVQKMLKKDTGICGIAPQSDVTMIKGLRSNGQARSRSTIIQALEKATQHKAQIINLSFKIDDRLDTTEQDVKMIEALLKKIPYVAACSGNDGSAVEAYPAKFKTVSFDVGAFGFYKDAQGNCQCPIPAFSQYQKGVGPLFMAPGQNILSCGISPEQKEDSVYVFMDGTSTATPMLSGFIALMLAEFTGKLSSFPEIERKQFLTLCYTNTFKMHATADWKEKTLLGVLDLRTILFMLRVLIRLKAYYSHKNIIVGSSKTKQALSFEQAFNHFVQAIHIILYDTVNEFAQEYALQASFTHAYMDFFNEIRTKKIKYTLPPMFASLETAITWVTDSVIYAVDQTTHKPEISTKIMNKVQQVFKQEEVDIFEGLQDDSYKRIQCYFS